MAERARLFLAVWPPAEAVDAIAALPRPERSAVRWTGPEQWHVTLRFLGTTEVAPVAAAVRQLVAPAPAAVMGPATARFGNRVLHVPVAGLEALAASVAAATGQLGQPPEDGPFRGHVTLARARGKGVDLRPYCEWPLSARWLATELTLVASRPAGRGVRYEVLERVTLLET